MKTKLCILAAVAVLVIAGVSFGGAKRLVSYNGTLTGQIVGTSAGTATSTAYPISNLTASGQKDVNYDGVMISFYMANHTAESSVDSLGKVDTTFLTTYTSRGVWRDTLGVDTITLPGYVVREYWTDDVSAGASFTTTLYGDSTAAGVVPTLVDGMRLGMFNDLLYFDISTEDSAMGASDTANWSITYQYRLIER